MMRRRLRPPVPIASAFVVAVAGAVLFGIATVRGDGAAGREIPPPFAPFEYLVGSWKGQGVSREDPSQRFRGWPETHAWAWTFSGGKPIAMSVTFQGSKLLKAATLTFDASKDRYQLKAEAVAPAGATIVYEGGLDASRKLLTLERTGVKSGDPAERLTLRANSNFIRYTLIADRKPAGRVQYAPAIEVGLTKEGETFAAGAQAVERRKCVVTGGAATLTVSFQGREFPICCTGCRDEFLETPDKYIKKASLASEAAAKGMPAKPAAGPSRVRGADDAFAGDVEEPSSKPEKEKAKSKSMDKAEPDDDAPAPKPKPAAKSADRAAGLLKIAQNLEKAGKPAAALKNYRELVKSFPDAPAAKTAKERIKALADQ